jgi:hypothetical protein
MAPIFAIFLIAVIAVFLRTEGRARRIERLSAFASRTTRFIRTVLARGTAAVELIAARLAEDHRDKNGLDRLLSAADRTRAAETGASSTDGLGASTKP